MSDRIDPRALAAVREIGMDEHPAYAKAVERAYAPAITALEQAREALKRAHPWVDLDRDTPGATEDAACIRAALAAIDALEKS